VLRNAEHRRHTIAERDIHSTIDCKFIIQLYRTFQDAEDLHMLMEICQGGELWALLREKSYLPDLTARFYIGCLVEALDYLHTRAIIYRDIKPENCLISNNGYLKLADMGLAKRIKANTKTFSFCGTAEYVPPEIILKTGHGYQVDLWALGILIYELVEGRPPLQGANPLETYQIILQGMAGVQFPPHVSSAAENIVRSLCRRKPQDRLGSGQGGFNLIRRHRWFKDFQWKDLRSQMMPAPSITTISSHLDNSCFDMIPVNTTSTSSSGYSSEGMESGETPGNFEFLEGWDF